MSTDILYNNVREEIVKLLTKRKVFDRYIINIPEGRSAGSVFSRNTKFPIEDLLSFMIMPRTESTAVELVRFSELTDRPMICKQAFFMKRRQLSDGIFDEINSRCINDLYCAGTSVRDWNGLYLMAFDGTTVKLPDTDDVRAAFPKGANQKGEYASPLARLEVLKDVLNGFVVDLQIDTLSASEPALAIRTMKALPQELVERSLFVFDRGYVGAA